MEKTATIKMNDMETGEGVDYKKMYEESKAEADRLREELNKTQGQVQRVILLYNDLFQRYLMGQ